MPKKTNIDVEQDESSDVSTEFPIQRIKRDLLNMRSQMIGKPINTYIKMAPGRIKEIPYEINEIKDLGSLTVKDNLLESITEGVCDLKILKQLDLTKNRIEEIPDCIGKLKKLEELKLGYNSIEVIPNTISGLRNLKKLELNNNRIQNVPKSVGKLKNLKSLDLRNNDTTELNRLPSNVCKRWREGKMNVYITNKTYNDLCQ